MQFVDRVRFLSPGTLIACALGFAAGLAPRCTRNAERPIHAERTLDAGEAEAGATPGTGSADDVHPLALVADHEIAGILRRHGAAGDSTARATFDVRCTMHPSARGTGFATRQCKVDWSAVADGSTCAQGSFELVVLDMAAWRFLAQVHEQRVPNLGDEAIEAAGTLYVRVGDLAATVANDTAGSLARDVLALAAPRLHDPWRSTAAVTEQATVRWTGSVRAQYLAGLDPTRLVTAAEVDAAARGGAPAADGPALDVRLEPVPDARPGYAESKCRIVWQPRDAGAAGPRGSLVLAALDFVAFDALKPADDELPRDAGSETIEADGAPCTRVGQRALRVESADAAASVARAILAAALARLPEDGRPR